MKQHVTVVGALYIGMGALGILAALLLLVVMGGTGFIVLASEGDGEAAPILWIIGCSVSSVLILLALPGIIGGIGVIKLKQWARYLVLILGVLNLLNVPIGTLVGVYTIWVLIQDETAELFADDYSALAAAHN